MRSKGLLVINTAGEQYLLAPEEGSLRHGYILAIYYQHQGQWIRLRPKSAERLRESLFGALLEFFGNLCRVLNQTSDTGQRIQSARIPDRTARLPTPQQFGVGHMRRRGYMNASEGRQNPACKEL